VDEKTVMGFMKEKKSKKDMILIVDDSLAARAFIGLKLKNAGYEVLLAEDGLEGIEELEYNKRVDLIILDIMMPNMNGIQMLHRLKLKMKVLKEKSTLDIGTVEMLDGSAPSTEENIERVKVLICSAKSDPNYIDLFMESGADDFIVKPIDEKVLIEKVERLIKKEKEQYARLKTNLAIELEGLEKDNKGTLLELSEISAKVEIPARISDGTKIVIISEVLNEKLKKPIKLTGHVLYSEKNMKNNYDTEIKLDLSEDSKKTLRSLTTISKGVSDKPKKKAS
jgi:DNA-binding response OmpR family regulator